MEGSPSHSSLPRAADPGPPTLISNHCADFSSGSQPVQGPEAYKEILYQSRFSRETEPIGEGESKRQREVIKNGLTLLWRKRSPRYVVGEGETQKSQ